MRIRRGPGAHGHSGPVRSARHYATRRPAPVSRIQLLRLRRAARQTHHPEHRRGAQSRLLRRSRSRTQEPGAGFVASSAERRCGPRGQRGDRMTPLRWGTGDHHGAASGDDGRGQGGDAVGTPHRRGEFTLTTKKRPGPALQRPALLRGHAEGERVAGLEVGSKNPAQRLPRSQGGFEISPLRQQRPPSLTTSPIAGTLRPLRCLKQ